MNLCPDAFNRQKWTALGLLCLCVIAVMSLWFSASAVVPTLTVAYDLSTFQTSLLTSSVQAGFVVGTLCSAFFGLADRLNPRRFFMGSTVVAAAANGLMLVADPGSISFILLRVLTGACMAGVYPVGMKMAAAWAKGDLGLLVAVLVGALTLGSATPHFFNAISNLDWQLTIACSSVAAALAAGLVGFVKLGPKQSPAPPFDPRHLLRAFTDRPLRLANFGYLGHMWELYAMWTWIGVFIDASFRDSSGPGHSSLAGFATFTVIGIGGLIGALAGGYYADRYGRTTITIIAMSISGSCALVAGLFYGANPFLVTTICLIWGISIIADSAQFSASVAELSDPNLVGTMLTVQTSAGFLLTLITVQLMPVVVDYGGWALAFALLALGPLCGVIAMWRLKRHPDSRRLAGGRR